VESRKLEAPPLAATKNTKNKHTKSKKIAVKDNKIDKVFARDKSKKLNVQKQNADDDDTRHPHYHHQEQTRRRVCGKSKKIAIKIPNVFAKFEKDNVKTLIAEYTLTINTTVNTVTRNPKNTVKKP
jgi:hypothetical protein